MKTNKNKHKKPSEVDAYIGQRIRQFRENAVMCQKDLGSKIGVTHQQIQKYETGENRISAAGLYRVAMSVRQAISNFFPQHEERN